MPIYFITLVPMVYSSREEFGLGGSESDKILNLSDCEIYPTQTMLTISNFSKLDIELCLPTQI